MPFKFTADNARLIVHVYGDKNTSPHTDCPHHRSECFKSTVDDFSNFHGSRSLDNADSMFVLCVSPCAVSIYCNVFYSCLIFYHSYLLLNEYRKD